MQLVNSTPLYEHLQGIKKKQRLIHVDYVPFYTSTLKLQRTQFQSVAMQKGTPKISLTNLRGVNERSNHNKRLIRPLRTLGEVC
ncbi:hypothetical protein AKG34_10205 [Peribacillus butanolivorans]|uniref:hypothetical protein n=1 Tax=Peribacillus butanolivorans TaxID=421767 RepID=UPI0006A6FF70|nr:hypothetical protein [Peribacillus butanolivorans]KON69118.1 hypothetical protein AKG34_10205 [Peribacillus butanolivorans]